MYRRAVPDHQQQLAPDLAQSMFEKADYVLSLENALSCSSIKSLPSGVMPLITER
jgi:hypothetical protein